MGNALDEKPPLQTMSGDLSNAPAAEFERRLGLAAAKKDLPDARRTRKRQRLQPWGCLNSLKFCLLVFLLSTPAHPDKAVASQGTACPASNFSDFIQKYSEDQKLQKTYIKLPLRYAYIDPSYGFEHEMLKSFSEIPYLKNSGGNILMPAADRARHHLKLSIRRDLSVVAASDDSDEGVVLFFVKIDGCWSLSAIKNLTL